MCARTQVQKANRRYDAAHPASDVEHSAGLARQRQVSASEQPTQQGQHSVGGDTAALSDAAHCE